MTHVPLVRRFENQHCKEKPISHRRSNFLERRDDFVDTSHKWGAGLVLHPLDYKFRALMFFLHQIYQCNPETSTHMIESAAAMPHGEHSSMTARTSQYICIVPLSASGYSLCLLIPPSFYLGIWCSAIYVPSPKMVPATERDDLHHRITAIIGQRPPREGREALSCILVAIVDDPPANFNLSSVILSNAQFVARVK